MNPNQRKTIRKKILKRLVDRLVVSGWRVGVLDGDQNDYLCEPTNDINAILAVCDTMDDEYLRVFHADGESFIHLDYMEDWDIISDYGMSLVTIMNPIEYWIENGCE